MEGAAQAQKSKTDMKMNGKRNITFKRDGLTLAGLLFTPENFDEKRRYKAVIVEGSFSSVKEQMPETYAQKFAAEGFVALAFDYSHYGESEGTPRQVESPADKLSDLKAAVTFLLGLPYVESVGMVGVCTSAGNAAYLAASDNRIKALATVAAFLSDPALFKLMYGEEGISKMRQAGAAAKRKYEETGAETMVPAYSEDDKSALNYAPKGSFDYYLNKSRGGIPQWKNEANVMAWEDWLAFDPISKAKAIKVPTIMVHSDGCAFPDQAKNFYSQLQGEKELVWADGTHFDYYDQPPQVNNAVKNVSRFFNGHLR
jgi:fermentation-respiration switch protein FrsA (DUF1100 family)